jgi:hypothetical protein
MQERGDQVASVLDVGQVGPRVTCRCQVSTWYFVASSTLLGAFFSVI